MLLSELLAVGVLTSPPVLVLAGLAFTGLLALIWRHGLTAIFLVLAWPFLLIAAALIGWVTYTNFVPAFSASVPLPQVATTLQLEFFRVNELLGGGLIQSGRYLTLTSPRGRVTYNMPGWDWPHRARTSVYVTQDKKFAVLGPDEEDILIDTEQSKISRAFRIPSQDWTYLGAFDFVQPVIGGYDRNLRFIPAAEQDECVPTDSLANETWPRNEQRKERCPTLQSKN